MKLRRIALDGFRNYTDFTADFSPGVNVIWGENAQGKTNLLEAISFLSGARSHRARGDKELISFHRDRGTITAEVTSRGRDFLLEVQLFRGARRRLFVNHVKCKTAAELGGIVLPGGPGPHQGRGRRAAVLSGPRDLSAPPPIRRGTGPVQQAPGP